MTAGRICNRDVVVAERATSLSEAARLMRERHVGSLVVVEQRKGENVPVGLLTDRDIIVEVVAKALSLEAISVGDIMAPELITVRESDSLWDALQRMRVKAVRRVPVVNERGGLEGILTVDDFLELLSGELADLATLITRELDRERNRRP